MDAFARMLPRSFLQRAGVPAKSFSGIRIKGLQVNKVEDVRRAVVTWIAMGMSDGDYSVREKKCVEALRKHFAKLKVARIEAEAEMWSRLSLAFQQAYGPDARQRAVDLVSPNFVTHVERLVAQYGDETGAARELKELVERGVK